jgi:hypothetical protein
LTCDGEGNIFATASLPSGGTVIEFPAGGQSGATALPIDLGSSPGGIAMNGSDLVLVYNGGIAEYTEAGVPTGVSFPTPAFRGIAISGCQCGTVVLGAGPNEVSAYVLSSGKLLRTYPTGGSPVGVTEGGVGVPHRRR